MRRFVLREAVIVAVETALLLGLSATLGIPTSDPEPVRAESKRAWRDFDGGLSAATKLSRGFNPEALASPDWRADD